jgi:acyl CoA:acetate/3-ketoacid CoA transferase
MSPAIQKLAVENKIAGHNLPQGVLSQLFRDTAAGMSTKAATKHSGGSTMASAMRKGAI